LGIVGKVIDFLAYWRYHKGPLGIGIAPGGTSLFAKKMSYGKGVEYTMIILGQQYSIRSEKKTEEEERDIIFQRWIAG